MSGLTLLDVTEGLQFLLSVGQLKGRNTPEDVRTWCENYHVVLEDVSPEAWKLALADVAKDQSQRYVPPAAWLRHRAYELQKATAPAAACTGSGVCEWCRDPRCAGVRDYVTARAERGPMVRMYAACDAKAKDYPEVSAVRCPHEGCGCPAVEVVIPNPFISHGHQRGPERLSMAIAETRVWAWECQVQTHPDFKGKAKLPPEVKDAR